jgi:hypothetical protein
MDCLRSFSVNSNLNQSFAAGVNFQTWLVGTDKFFVAQTTTATASFLVNGFKNINIYGMDVMGDFYSGNGTSKAIIDDWQTTVEFIGQNPLLGGSVAINALNVNIETYYTNVFVVSKYKRNIQFSTPIQSVSEITFDQFRVQGHANESISFVTVNWNLNYVFYYKFEGE